MPKDSTPRILPFLIVKVPPSPSGKTVPMVADLERFRAGEDFADGEVVGVLVLAAGDDLRDDHAVRDLADGFDLLDLKARHGERVGEFLRGKGDVDVVFQSKQGKFHVSRPFSELFEEPQIVVGEDAQIVDAVL